MIYFTAIVLNILLVAVLLLLKWCYSYEFMLSKISYGDLFPSLSYNFHTYPYLFKWKCCFVYCIISFYNLFPKLVYVSVLFNWGNSLWLPKAVISYTIYKTLVYYDIILYFQFHGIVWLCHRYSRYQHKSNLERVFFIVGSTFLSYP